MSFHHAECMSLREFAGRRTSCLTNVDGNLVLKRTHTYYYQVQTQMYVCGVQAADFVIWFPDGLFVETVAVDHSLVKEFLPRLEKFYISHYLPAVHAALM